MQDFLTALLSKEKSSGQTNYPKPILNEVIAKIAKLKGELKKNYSKDDIPEDKHLILIPELFDLVSDLKVIYARRE